MVGGFHCSSTCNVLLLEAVVLLADHRRKTGCTSPIVGVIGCGTTPIQVGCRALVALSCNLKILA